MKHVIIIGSGPAGISAALYTKRGNLQTTVVGKDAGALEKAHLIENYYGLLKPVSGKCLHDNGVKQAKALGCTVIEEEVVSIGYDGRFTVGLKGRILQADAVILATGAVRDTPNIPGLTNFEGKGVSYCAVCDAFFYRNREVAVLGSGAYALHEAETLLQTAARVTLLTDGSDPKGSVPANIQVDKRKIQSVTGDTQIGGISFEDGEPLPVAGLFVAVGVASSGDLARKLGVILDGTRIAVNDRMETNVKGLFAAGDCTGGMLQAAAAVHEGAAAGMSAIAFLK